jgi:hypothetical protein
VHSTQIHAWKKQGIENLLNGLCAGHGKEVEDESSLQADLKRSASLDKVILVRE